eukprot:COSAG01_NODE_16287_length_1250_cov_2.686360_1_plen_76_part_10
MHTRCIWSARGPGDRFLLTIPECMQINTRCLLAARLESRRARAWGGAAAGATATGFDRWSAVVRTHLGHLSDPAEI